MIVSGKNRGHGKKSKTDKKRLIKFSGINFQMQK